MNYLNTPYKVFLSIAVKVVNFGILHFALIFVVSQCRGFDA